MRASPSSSTKLGCSCAFSPSTGTDTLPRCWSESTAIIPRFSKPWPEKIPMRLPKLSRSISRPASANGWRTSIIGSARHLCVTAFPVFSTYTARGRADAHAARWRISLVGRRDAVVRVSVQLRGPAGNFLRLPGSENPTPSQRRGTRSRRLVLHVDVRVVRPRGRMVGRSLQTQKHYHRRSGFLVGRYRGYGSLPRLLGTHLCPCARRFGRSLLFSGGHVSDQRLSQRSHPLARHVGASIERLRRHHRRRERSRLRRAILRLEMELYSVRRHRL